MRIAIVSDYETHGGAAIATTRFAEEWSRTGASVRRLVFRPDAAKARDAVDIGGRISRSLPFRAMAKMAPCVVASEVGSRLCLRQLYERLREFRPDVINIHNVHGAWWANVSEDILDVCGQVAPLVWTLHDMWSFTGSCAYSLNCEGFLTRCGSFCTAASSHFPFRASAVPREWERKKAALSRHADAVAVTPSAWLKALAVQGLWSQNTVHVIPNGIDTERYRPIDRAAVRKALGLDARSTIVLASYYEVPRYKGAELLRHVIRALRRVRDIQWLLIGSEIPAVLAAEPNVRALGYVAREAAKVEFFSAADLYVHPSLAENLPNTIVEAMCCGTPTVAFEVGGVPELVRPGITGWLARSCTKQGLTETTAEALATLNTSDLRSSCRQVGVAEYSVNTQGHKYLDLFADLIAEG